MRRQRGADFEDSYCCAPLGRHRGVPPPRYDPNYEGGSQRPNSYPQGPYRGGSFSGQIYLPPRVPASSSFDEMDLTRMTEGSAASSTPLMGRGFNYVRGK